MFAGNKEFVIALDEGTTNAKPSHLMVSVTWWRSFLNHWLFRRYVKAGLSNPGSVNSRLAGCYCPCHQPRGGRKCSGSGYQ